jgi:predicted kinase
MCNLNEFIYWYFNEFQKNTELYLPMAEISEDSPWHRERSIATHTDMVVTQYLTVTGELWKLMLLGAFASAFHDTGKPKALERKWSEARGDYKAFHGHEVISARLWEDYAVTNWDMLRTRFELNAEDIYRVGYMIEHHVPFQLKDAEKLQNMARTLQLGFFGHYGFSGFDAFKRLLLADTAGRISDDAESKRHKTSTWVHNFHNDYMLPLDKIGFPELENKPVLYMPIGASGLGKSILFKNRKYDIRDVLEYSWDKLRLDWYVEGESFESEAEKYQTAFERSTEDKDFNQKSQRAFIEMVRTGANIAVDNTNLKRKRRRFFTTEARRHGYALVAILMPSALETLKQRQRTRTDKHLYHSIVERQYLSMQLPQYGEFDYVWVLESNLPDNAKEKDDD